MKLTPRQQKLMDAIPLDGLWHRFPNGTLSQTILSLEAKKLIKLRLKPGHSFNAYLQMCYYNSCEVTRL